MAGDEIVADWLGDTMSFYVTTAGTVNRFSGASLRYRNVHINNPSTTKSAWIGWYNSNTTTFMNFALLITSSEFIEFEFIDLYNLGFYWYGSTGTDLKILCVNEY